MSKRNYQRGTDRYNAVLTPEKVRHIRANPHVKNSAMAAQMGCSEGSIEHVHHRRTWQHVQ